MSLGRKIKEMSLRISGFFFPVFQFVPNTWTYAGFMSMPLICYFSIVAKASPRILTYVWRDISHTLFDFGFLFWNWDELTSPLLAMVCYSVRVFLARAVFFGGLVLFMYSLYYLHRHADGMVDSGPYKRVRHPQYLGIIMMTGGITLFTLPYDPVFVLGESFGEGLDQVLSKLGSTSILLVWLGEVVAYIALAKLEELHLTSRFGNAYLRYKESTPFLVPFLGLLRRTPG